MKKTLLSLALLTFTMGIFAQDFSTGLVTLSGDLSVQLDISSTNNQTTLTLNGPADKWLAVGFGGSDMTSGTDVFRTDGTNITDAKTITTAKPLPPADTQQDWTLVSNTVTGSIRTIVATRANDTGDSDDFIFNASAGNISMIWAYGTSTTYGYHAARGATMVGVILGISETERLNFNIFPNPLTENAINVQLPAGVNEGKISLYDYSGRLVKTQNISSINKEVDVQDISSGAYIMKVQAGEKLGTKQLIKQ